MGDRSVVTWVIRKDVHACEPFHTVRPLVASGGVRRCAAWPGLPQPLQLSCKGVTRRSCAALLLSRDLDTPGSPGLDVLLPRACGSIRPPPTPIGRVAAIATPSGG